MGNAADLHNAPAQPAPEQHGASIEMAAGPQHTASSNSVPQHVEQHPDAIRAQDAGPVELPPAYPAGGQQQNKGPALQGHPAPHGNPVPLGQLRHDGQVIDCPWCLKRATARMTEDGQGMQIVTGVLIGLCCICLACLPCCLGWFVERTWTCSECGHKVAMASEGENNPTVPVTPDSGHVQNYHQQYQQRVQQLQQQEQGHPGQGLPQGAPAVQQQQPVQEPPMAHGK